jgi:hypothetical protein
MDQISVSVLLEQLIIWFLKVILGVGKNKNRLKLWLLEKNFLKIIFFFKNYLLIFDNIIFY